LDTEDQGSICASNIRNSQKWPSVNSKDPSLKVARSAWLLGTFDNKFGWPHWLGIQGLSSPLVAMLTESKIVQFFPSPLGWPRACFEYQSLPSAVQYQTERRLTPYFGDLNFTHRGPLLVPEHCGIVISCLWRLSVVPPEGRRLPYPPIILLDARKRFTVDMVAYSASIAKLCIERYYVISFLNTTPLSPRQEQGSKSRYSRIKVDIKLLM
jgi:hypothetical protein